MKLLRKIKKTGGFTLIELLVVIAIIGVLSSVVLASLGTARGKGANAAIKGNLNNLRGQMELFYDSNGSSYGSYTVANCPSAATSPATTGLHDAPAVNMLESARAAAGAYAKCKAAGSYWWVSSPLKAQEGSNLYWCVDSTGNVTGKQLQPADGYTSCTS